MCSYPSNKVIPEVNCRSSVSQITCLHLGGYFPSSKPELCPPHGTQSNPEPALAIPLRSIPPPDESVKANNSGSQTKKVGKHKALRVETQPIGSKLKRPKLKGRVTPEAIRERKSLDCNLDVRNFDFSRIPLPFCSCTGVARVCYKWGSGGWQSSCCTINISEYPLPTSSTRPGIRIAGRKMSSRAYAKVLSRLAAEGHDLSFPVDLKAHWARHGTNKFVTIK